MRFLTIHAHRVPATTAQTTGEKTMLRSGIPIITGLTFALIGGLGVLTGCGPGEGRASTTSARSSEASLRFAPVMDALRAEGFSAKAQDDDAARDAALAQLGWLATSASALVVSVDGALDVVLVERAANASATAILEAPPVFLHLNDVRIVPAAGDVRVWEKLISAMHARGGRYVEARGDLLALLSNLQTLRSQIEIYQVRRRWQPSEASQWGDLFHPEMLTSRPKNPLAASGVASRLAIIAKPGATGVDVSPTSAGWVWNSADQMLYPAGVAEEQVESAVRAMSDCSPFADRRRVELKGMLGGYRAAIANFRIQNATNGQPRNPTLEEMSAGKVLRSPSGQSTANPFNGSAAIQSAEWDADQPMVKGAAGWNYDPNTGKFWANSDIGGEHAF
jgi:hypothetical protein